MTDLRYPVGAFESKLSLSAEERRAMIDIIAAAPLRMREAVGGLTDTQLDTPYRDGGWTLRQVVHHVPDSHMNAYVRFKLALTEDEPTVRPYDEAAWAKLADSRVTPVEVSLALLDALHARWSDLLRSMTDGDFARRFRHPDRGLMSVDWLVAMYSWHSRHHVGHVTSLRERMKW